MDSDVIATEADGTLRIALPCAPEDFSSFVGGLLGKPQTISKAYAGSFEIRHADLTSAYHLVVQRVRQQNQANLIQFTVRLVYDDDSSVLLNSYDDFANYSEVRPLVVTQAHLSWTFLVKFEDHRKHPEKQVIDLSFITRGSERLPIYDFEDEPVFPIYFLSGGHISAVSQYS